MAGVLAPLGRIAAAQQPVPRRVYFDDPEYQNAQISPDGALLAYFAQLDGVRNLWFAPG